MSCSVFPAAVDHLPSDHMFFGTGFTPWETEASFVYPPEDQVEPVLSFSGSDLSNQKTNSSNSGSDDKNPIDERKRRRMVSNRESARRSRMRKQKHLDNLRNQLNRHKTGNRELMNRLRFVSHQEQFLRVENERLRAESATLRQKLWDMHQVVLVRQLQNQLLSSPSPSVPVSAWPCNNNVTSIYQ